MKKLSIALAGILVLGSGGFANAEIRTEIQSWGLDRLDQTTTEFDLTYNYPDSAGAGVRVYVLDTGVETNLPGFDNRVIRGFDALAKPRDRSMANRDCHGHGTGIAGVIASNTYGIAKQATIVPVRVADCRGGVSPDSLVKGINWVLKNHPRNTPGVVNLSVAVNKSRAVDTAIGKLYNAGLVPVVAAGNQNADACRLSPAGSPRSLTVGSVNMNDYRTNNSNYGECVSIFAPGGLITTEGKNGSPRTTSGTSLAAAHVTGVIALYLSENPRAKSPEVIGAITSNGLGGVVVDAKSNKGNILLNSMFLNK